eukprot:Clim_evm4s83 gene=Clim_evmTU4s83
MAPMPVKLASNATSLQTALEDTLQKLIDNERDIKTAEQVHVPELPVELWTRILRHMACGGDASDPRSALDRPCGANIDILRAAATCRKVRAAWLAGGLGTAPIVVRKEFTNGTSTERFMFHALELEHKLPILWHIFTAFSEESLFTRLCQNLRQLHSPVALEIVDYHGCGIAKHPSRLLARIPHLHTVILRGLLRSTIPEELVDCTSLRCLELLYSFVPILHIGERVPPNLNRLVLKGNHLGSIGGLSRLSNQLEELIITANPIRQMPRDVETLTKLRTLHLNVGMLSSVPEHISYLQRLTHVDFSSNSLQQFPLGLLEIQGLEIINLGSNAISDVPTSIASRLPHLRYLDLSQNQLYTFPPEIIIMPSLRSLRLSLNRLTQDAFMALNLAAERRERDHMPYLFVTARSNLSKDAAMVLRDTAIGCLIQEL